MKIRIQKLGNSLALRIPKIYAAEMNLTAGAVVDVLMTDGTLVIKPITKSVPILKELLSKVTQENRHHEVETGAAAGNEAW